MLNITQPGRKRLHFTSNVIQLELSFSGRPPTMRYRECLSLTCHKILKRRANENDSSKSDLSRGKMPFKLRDLILSISKKSYLNGVLFIVKYPLPLSVA